MIYVSWYIYGDSICLKKYSEVSSFYDRKDENGEDLINLIDLKETQIYGWPHLGLQINYFQSILCGDSGGLVGRKDRYLQICVVNIFISRLLKTFSRVSPFCSVLIRNDSRTELESGMQEGIKVNAIF